MSWWHKHNANIRESIKQPVGSAASYLPVRGDEFEGLGHLMSCGSSSDIQEVGWRATVEFDDVHGGHGETCSIY